jgi:CobB/CobQ-like glutamine amidotransferase domain/AIR synthase related protein, N-terminal domain/Formylglycinamide ribonucleotide amidotransferase linker domain
VLSICNGFQILCEAHPLPGALTRNAGLKFITRDVRLRVENADTAWTRRYSGGQQIVVPLKSGEGAYAAGPGTLADLEASGQVVIRYAGDNPNGSAAAIAGVCNAEGTVVGLMPHPEHAVDPGHRPVVRRPRLLRLRGRGGGGASPVGTVARAAAEADLPQPFAELGLTRDEYETIVATLGRRPTGAELALYSVMWGEHCSYKSSKVHPRQFAAKAPPSGALLAGIGHTAGVVDIGQGYAVTFKIESHNHPSYVEPHQGPATGVGGIVRDILAMGARPAGAMDALRFGPADAPDTGRVLPGVVGDNFFYGDCLGLPNIRGNSTSTRATRAIRWSTRSAWE